VETGIENDSPLDVQLTRRPHHIDLRFVLPLTVVIAGPVAATYRKPTAHVASRTSASGDYPYFDAAIQIQRVVIGIENELPEPVQPFPIA